jgi:3-(3-hydroxy-phenyl)propionate hydroxylase
VRLPDQIPVLVVGAGPTGLTATHLLACYGVETLLIDAAPEPLVIPRAVSLDDEGLRTMDACGLAEKVAACVRTSQGSRYYLEGSVPFADVGPGPQEYGWPRRSIFHQPDLECALTDALRERPQATIARSVRLLGFRQTPDRVVATLERDGRQHDVQAAVLIAADGGRSTVRAQFGYSMEGDTYPQDWIVLDLARDPNDEPVSQFHCDPARPWVSIPTPFGGRRYEFMLLPGERGEDMLTLDALRGLLAPVRALAEDDIIRAAIYTFHARVSSRWGAGRVWLAGDAAHLTPPFAGQGMNAGIRDAHNIAWKAAMVACEEAPHAILSSYEAERKDPARAMIELAVAMGEVIMAVGAEQLKMRDALFIGLKRFPAVKDWLFQMKFKPKPRYDRGLFIDLDSVDQVPASLVGQMIPNPQVFGPDGGLQLLDAQLGGWFAEMGQGAALPWPADGPDRIGLRPLRAHRDQCVLIRPDRYVAGAGESPAAVRAAWVRQLENWGSA